MDSVEFSKVDIEIENPNIIENQKIQKFIDSRFSIFGTIRDVEKFFIVSSFFSSTNRRSIDRLRARSKILDSIKSGKNRSTSKPRNIGSSSMWQKSQIITDSEIDTESLPEKNSKSKNSKTSASHEIFRRRIFLKFQNIDSCPPLFHIRDKTKRRK